MDNNVSHKDLLALLRLGDRRAFETIYGLYSGRVYNFVLSILSDRYVAEETTQDLFMKIWERRESIDVEQNFEAYLFTIVRRLVYKQIEERVERIERLTPLNDTLATASRMDELRFEAESLRQHIDRVIDRLPDVQRKVFVLSRKHYLSHKEIAAQLSISERTVETHIYRALQAIRLHIDDRALLVASLFIF